MPEVHYKLGKQRPLIDSRTLQFGAYLTESLPAPPVSIDYTKAVSQWPMMGNDNYGDCTCAAAGHMIMDWTANTGNELVVPDSVVLSFYNHFAHGNADAGANGADDEGAGGAITPLSAEPVGGTSFMN